MRRRQDNPKHRGSGVVSVLFLTFALIGWLFPWSEDPPTLVDCTPVTATRYPSATESLLGQGYIRDGDVLTPPGCQR